MPVSEDEKIRVTILKPAQLTSKSLGQAIRLASGQAGSSQGKTGATPDTKKRDSKSEKIDDTSSVVSAKAGTNTGKRFSLSKTFSSSRKSQSESTPHPTPFAEGSVQDSVSAPSQTRIVAQWDGADADGDGNSANDNVDGNVVGTLRAEEVSDMDFTVTDADGKMNWLLYDLQPQGTVNLLLEWEVSAVSTVEVLEREA